MRKVDGFLADDGTYFMSEVSARGLMPQLTVEIWKGYKPIAEMLNNARSQAKNR